MEFDPVDVATWTAQVERELRGRPLSKLAAGLPGGLSIAPLYTAADRPGDGGLPGAAPYTRGAALWSPWDSSPRHDDPRRDELRDAIREDVGNGAEGIWLRLDRRARLGGLSGDDGATLYTVADFADALEGVDLSTLHARLDAGASALPAAAAWTALAARQGTDLSAARLRFCMDPAGALMRDGALPSSLPELWRQAADLIAGCEADLPAARALTVSTGPAHTAGSDAPLELAVALGGIAAALEGLGGTLDAARIAAQIELSVPMGRDIFLNIARLRALRTLWSHLLSHCGVADVPAPDVHAFSAPITLTKRDPWANMLRVTTQVFSAIVGGAQRITAAAFDEAIGQPEALGRRVARNTPLILREESHLSAVTDPAGGSHYVEALTAQLTEAAWGRFQQLQAQGGIFGALDSGWLQGELAACWGARRAQIARRTWPIIGVSTFPSLDEAPQARFQGLSDGDRPQPADAPLALDAGVDLAGLRAAAEAGASVWSLQQSLGEGGVSAAALPRRRDAAPFESLRDRADAASARPTVFLATLGGRSAWTARANFAANLLAAGGIAVIEDDGAEDAAVIAERFAASGAGVACICGSDDAYGSLGAAVAAALAERGLVLLAGRPDDALAEAGVSLFIHLGCDALDALSTVLDRLGA